MPLTVYKGPVGIAASISETNISLTPASMNLTKKLQAKEHVSR